MPQAQQGMNVSDSAQINAGVIQNSDIADDTILNAKINSAAAIAQSKIALAITNAEVAGAAAIADTKLAQITAAGKVSGAALTSLASIPAGAGIIPPANLPATGEWAELGETTLGADAATLSVASFAARKYLWVVIHIIGRTIDNNITMTFNSDTGSNYCRRTSLNGAADVDTLNAANLDLGSIGTAENAHYIFYITNRGAQEKLGIGHLLRTATAGAGTTPERREMMIKWANTAAQITTITLTQSSGNILAGSRMAVYGTSD